MASLTFGQVEAILARLENVHPSKRGALQSRLKQWRLMGFPAGIQGVGRGVKAAYGADQLFQLVYLLELLRVGLTPERAIDAVTYAWDEIRSSIHDPIVCMAAEADHSHYTSIEIDALTSFADPTADHLHVYCRRWTDKELATAMILTEDRVPEDEVARFRKFRFRALDKVARSITLETDSLVLRVWLAMHECAIEATILKPDLLKWSRLAREREPEQIALPVADPSPDIPEPVDGYSLARASLGFSSAEEVLKEFGRRHEDEDEGAPDEDAPEREEAVHGEPAS